MKGASDLGPLLSASSRPDPGHTVQGTGDGPDIRGGEMMCTYSALPRIFADFPYGEVYDPAPRTARASCRTTKSLTQSRRVPEPQARTTFDVRYGRDERRSETRKLNDDLVEA